MSWIGVRSDHLGGKSTVPNISLEHPITVIARGIGPAHAVVEQLNASECRVRSAVWLGRGDAIEFVYHAGSEEAAMVRGTVTSHVAVGTHFVYKVRLNRMSAAELDALAHVVAKEQRRLATARSHLVPVDLSAARESKRSAFRVLAPFPIAYRPMRSQFKPAKAENVSAGGLSMICPEFLHEGDLLELRFTPPLEVLSVYPEAAKERRRPFEEMLVTARVVRARALGPKKFTYGLSLIGIDSYQHEELARYVSAVSLSRNHH